MRPRERRSPGAAARRGIPAPLLRVLPLQAVEIAERQLIQRVPQALPFLLRALGAEALRVIQGRKFLRQFRHAYRNVPAYRETCRKAGLSLSDVRGPGDVRKLPFLDVSYIRQNPLERILAEPPSNVVKFVESSGSAGKPKVIGYVKRDAESVRGSIGFALRALFGIAPNALLLNEFAYGLWPTGVLLHEGAEKAGLRCIAGNMNVGPGYQIEVIQRYRPAVLAALPAYLLLLAQHAQEVGLSLRECGVRKIVLGGEPTTRRLREEISRTYGAEVFNVYGATEIGIGAAGECSRHDGMHTNANLLVEIIDRDGNPLPPGLEGEIVLSHLAMSGLPLLRYRTGDLSSVLPEECPCGLPLPRLRDIFHRADNMLIIAGANVYPGEIDDSLGPVAKAWKLVIAKRTGIPVLKFAVEPQEGVGRADVLDRLVGSRSAMPETFRKVHEAGLLKIEVEFAKLPPDTSLVSGKKRFSIVIEP